MAPNPVAPPTGLSLVQALLLITTVGALSVGQILFKLAANRLHGDGLSVAGVATNTPLWAALIIYGGATIAWVALLRQVPLSAAYPFVALAFFIVPMLGLLFLGEKVTPQQWGGAALIAAGVWLSSRGSA